MLKDMIISTIVGLTIGLTITLACYIPNPPLNVEAKTIIEEETKVHLGEFKTTAYCSCYDCCNKTDGIANSGTKVKEGRTVAVDPNVIPLGSIIEIDGDRYIAEDIGGAIKGNRVDVYFNDHQDALDYGVQTHEVVLVVDSI